MRHSTFQAVACLFKKIHKNMKRTILITAALMATLFTFAQTMSFHDFKVNTITGEVYDLAQLKGKKVLVVNTASKCGLTPQYAQLQELFETYGGENFTIIGFPANNFMNQEPGSNEEIAEFCETNYGVSFQMMEKISVKGDDIHPLYSWLTNKSENGVLDASVSWNFQKFLIDENGKLVDSISPRKSPTSSEIVDWITKN
jgi:glutathione peroxidase